VPISIPAARTINLNLFTVQTDSGTTDKAIECYGVDENYLSTLNIPIVGVAIFQVFSDTLHSILVNEATVKHFRWKQRLATGKISGRYFW
jgi:hypothetical protein